MFGFTMSSRTKTTNGSTNDDRPFGGPGFLLELLPTLPKIKMRTNIEAKSEATFFVIEKSINSEKLKTQNKSPTKNM